jgi:hypothetical protein
VRSRRATVATRIGGDYPPTGGNESCGDASRNPVTPVVRGEAVQEHDDPSSTIVEIRNVRSVKRSEVLHCPPWSKVEGAHRWSAHRRQSYVWGRLSASRAESLVSEARRNVLPNSTGAFRLANPEVQDFGVA